MKQLVLAAVLMLAGCGTRKTETSISKSDIRIDSELNTELKAEQKISSGSDDTGHIVTKTSTVKEATVERMRPIDPAKPMKKTDSEGKTTTYENVILDFGSESTNTYEEIDESYNRKDTSDTASSFEVRSDSKLTTDASAYEKEKNIEKSGYNGLIPLGIGLALFIGILWFIIKKSKNENDKDPIT